MLVRFTNAATFLATTAALGLPFGCDGEGTSDPSDAPHQKGANGSAADASAEAVVIDLAFSAELLASTCFSPRQTVQDQLLYTIGQLNGHRGVGRLDRMEVTDIVTSEGEAGCTITYKARLPVAWGDKHNVPTKLSLFLPKDVTYEGLDRFTESYKETCVDHGAHDVSSGSMWYYFRPANDECELAPADIVKPTALVSVSPVNTTGKYPEFDKVWEDGALQVVAVFGKYEDGATTAVDAGIAAYNTFVKSVARDLSTFSPTTTPATVPESPGVANPDIEFNAVLPDGRKVKVVALLVDNVREGGPGFEARYAALSTRADLIVYNGHAALGANVRHMARIGDWVTGQYVIVFINGCDSYAYIDTALNEAHSDVNDDDRDGTKYVDIVTNAMPSFFKSMAGATMAMIRGLLAKDTPRTFEQIFVSIDAAEVVIVTGEHDNTFMPGAATTPADPAWSGLAQRGSLTADGDVRFETPALPAGKYRFGITGTGDVDLYVRIGGAPDDELYDCRPYLTGSAETCDVELSAAAPVHIRLNAFGSAANFVLTGAKR